MRKPRGNRRPGGSFSKAARCMCSNRSRRGVELSSGRLGASSTRCQPRIVTSSPGCPLSSTFVRLKYRRTQVDRRVGLPRGIVAGSIQWQLRSPGPARERCRRACVGRRRVTLQTYLARTQHAGAPWSTFPTTTGRIEASPTGAVGRILRASCGSPASTTNLGASCQPGVAPR
jgi:hypothetical protein